MNKQALLLILIILNIGSAALAQEASSTMAMEATPSQKENPFHLTMSLTSASNLYKENSPERESSSELFLNPSLKFSEETSLVLKSWITHEENKARNTELANTNVILSTKGPQLGPIESAGNLLGVLPTNENIRKSDSYQGAAGIGFALKGQWRNLQTNYSLAVSRNFHQYTVNADRSPNVQYRLSQGLTFDLELSSLWSLSAAGVYKHGWTYGNFERDNFEAEVGVNYNVSKSLQLSAAISNEGNALKSNGTDSNIQIYNENTSAIKASVTFVN